MLKPPPLKDTILSDPQFWQGTFPLLGLRKPAKVMNFNLLTSK